MEESLYRIKTVLAFTGMFFFVVYQMFLLESYVKMHWMSHF